MEAITFPLPTANGTCPLVPNQERAAEKLWSVLQMICAGASFSVTRKFSQQNTLWIHTTIGSSQQIRIISRGKVRENCTSELSYGLVCENLRWEDASGVRRCWSEEQWGSMLEIGTRERFEAMAHLTLRRRAMVSSARLNTCTQVECRPAVVSTRASRFHPHEEWSSNSPATRYKDLDYLKAAVTKAWNDIDGNYLCATCDTFMTLLRSSSEHGRMRRALLINIKKFWLLRNLVKVVKFCFRFKLLVLHWHFDYLRPITNAHPVMMRIRGVLCSVTKFAVHPKIVNRGWKPHTCALQLQISPKWQPQKQESKRCNSLGSQLCDCNLNRTEQNRIIKPKVTQNLQKFIAKVGFFVILKSDIFEDLFNVESVLLS